MQWVLDNFVETAAEAKRAADKFIGFLGVDESILKSYELGSIPETAVSSATVSMAQEITIKPAESKKKSAQISPVMVDKFDELISDNGLESGSTILVSGGCGTGKTTFVMQSLYNAAKHGEKCIYISFEEEPFKIKQHMKKNFGWDLEEFEKKGNFAIIKFDPIKIARSVEASIAAKKGYLRISSNKLELPFTPDRVGVDSLSALSIAFENTEKYRKYVRELFENLDGYNSLNFIIAETEQDPRIYSRTGVEEFLADGVVVLYNVIDGDKRKKALEILKLRSSKHVDKMVPYKITDHGIKILYTKGGKDAT